MRISDNIKADTMNLEARDTDLITFYLSMKQSENLTPQAEFAIKAARDNLLKIKNASGIHARLEKYKCRIDTGEIPDVPQNVIDWMKQNELPVHSKSGSLQDDIDTIKSLKKEKADTEQKLEQYNNDLENLIRDLDSCTKEKHTLNEKLEKLNQQLKINPDDPEIGEQIIQVRERLETVHLEIASLNNNISLKKDNIASLNEKISSLEKETKHHTLTMCTNLDQNLEGIVNFSEDKLNQVRQSIDRIKDLSEKQKQLFRTAIATYKNTNKMKTNFENEKTNDEDLRRDEKKQQDTKEDDIRQYEEYKKLKKDLL